MSLIVLECAIVTINIYMKDVKTCIRFRKKKIRNYKIPFQIFARKKKAQQCDIKTSFTVRLLFFFFFNDRQNSEEEKKRRNNHQNSTPEHHTTDKCDIIRKPPHLRKRNMLKSI